MTGVDPLSVPATMRAIKLLAKEAGFEPNEWQQYVAERMLIDGEARLPSWRHLPAHSRVTIERRAAGVELDTFTVDELTRSPIERHVDMLCWQYRDQLDQAGVRR